MRSGSFGLALACGTSRRSFSMHCIGHAPGPLRMQRPDSLPMSSLRRTGWRSAGPTLTRDWSGARRCSAGHFLGEAETLMLLSSRGGCLVSRHRHGCGRPVHVWDIFGAGHSNMFDVYIRRDCAALPPRMAPLGGMAHVGGRFPFLLRLLQHATRKESRFFSFLIAQATRPRRLAEEGFRLQQSILCPRRRNVAIACISSATPTLSMSFCMCFACCWVPGEMYPPSGLGYVNKHEYFLPSSPSSHQPPKERKKRPKPRKRGSEGKRYLGVDLPLDPSDASPLFFSISICLILLAPGPERPFPGGGGGPGWRKPGWSA